MKIKPILAVAVTLMILPSHAVSTQVIEEGHQANEVITYGTEKAKGKPYPLDYCIVSDEKLGEMGDAIVMTYKGQELKFCCKPCVKDFKEDPEKYLKLLEKAAKKK
ncbi:MAG: YHS domain-containing protein [Akkermansiaceae bacterium]